MTTNYVYPTNSELQLVAAEKAPVLVLADPIFRFVPIVDVDAHLLEWDQLDNFVGLQQVRGLNGQPGNVTAVGGTRFRATPGVYGEFMTIDEEELTTRRQFGSFATPVNITDLVMNRQDQLLNRRIDRIRYIIWKLITTGTFSVSNNNGVVHTDTYTLQTYDASSWGTPSTATPLADARAVQLLGRGKGVSFGAGATEFMNRVTFNKMIANTNSADLAGRRTAGLSLATVLSLADTNALLAGEDLPQIEVFDDGYLNDAGTFVPFIGDNISVVIGQRQGGQTIADYAMTRNANNPNLEPGAYMKIIDRGEEDVPRTIEVHDGHNGGPRIYYPGSIVIKDVS